MTDTLSLDDLKKIIGHSTELPTLPIIITQLFQTLNDSKSSVQDAATIIANDPTITAKILRLVNSAAFGLGRKISSIEEAVSLLGFSSVMNLSVSSAILDSFKIQQFNVNQFWKHAIATSMTSKYFSELTNNPHYPKVCSTLGLIHDIGKFLFMMKLPEKYLKIVSTIESHPDKLIPAYKLERKVLGVDHCQAGFLLAKYWGWPGLYQDIILSHHSPSKARIHPILNLCVYLGNLVTHKVYDPSFKNLTFEKAIQLVKDSPELFELFNENNWNNCIIYLEERQDEIEKYVEPI